MAEPASFVLAGFPLIIEGVRVYIEGYKFINYWWQYAKFLEEFYRDIRMEKTKFINTCDRLLSDLVDEECLILLLNDTKGTHWQEKDFQASLRSRLGRSFDPFTEAVNKMMMIIEDFKKSLGIKSDDEFVSESKWREYLGCAEKFC